MADSAADISKLVTWCGCRDKELRKYYSTELEVGDFVDGLEYAG